MAVAPGRDMLTLLTCTPYQVSTHRLLVHADRVPDATSAVPTLPAPGASQGPSPMREATVNRATSYATAAIGMLAGIATTGVWLGRGGGGAREAPARRRRTLAS